MTDTVGEEIRSSDEPLRIRTWQETLQRGEHKKPLNERIDAMTYIKPFPIKEVDLLTIKRFINFSRFNSKNDWGVGLKMLLDYADGDAKIMMLYDRILQVERDVEGIIIALDEPKQQQKEQTKRTFGMRREVKKDE